MANVIASVDAHLHLHPCYDPDHLLRNDYDNLAGVNSDADHAPRVLTQMGASLERFATLEPPLRFVRNQIRMQLRKRLRA